MRDFDETNITDAVVDRFQMTPDPRLKRIMTSLVEHLHYFVRDVELTFDEWQYAIEYLTRTGQTCTSTRQEFILLSDTLGVSMLVDAINHRMPEDATETTVLGPFYVKDPPQLPHGTDVSYGQSGEPLYVQGIVRSANGSVLADAIVDIWHSDADGFMMCSVMTSPSRPSGHDSKPMRRAIFIFGLSCRSSTRSRTTDRWARCLRRLAGIHIVRRTCTS